MFNLFVLPAYDEGNFLVREARKNEFGDECPTKVVEVSVDLFGRDLGSVAAFEAVFGPGESPAVDDDVAFGADACDSVLSISSLFEPLSKLSVDRDDSTGLAFGGHGEDDGRGSDHSPCELKDVFLPEAGESSELYDILDVLRGIESIESIPVLLLPYEVGAVDFVKGLDLGSDVDLEQALIDSIGEELAHHASSHIRSSGLLLPLVLPGNDFASHSSVLEGFDGGLAEVQRDPGQVPAVLKASAFCEIAVLWPFLELPNEVVDSHNVLAAGVMSSDSPLLLGENAGGDLGILPFGSVYAGATTPGVDVVSDPGDEGLFDDMQACHDLSHPSRCHRTRRRRFAFFAHGRERYPA